MSTVSVPLSGTYRVARTREPFTRAASAICFTFGMILCVSAESMQSPLWLSIGTLLGAAAIVIRAVGRVQRGGVNPAILYAAAAAATALGNTVSYASIDSPQKYTYFSYADMRYLMFAAEATWVGTFLPVLGFMMVDQWAPARSLFGVVPLVRGHVSDKRLIRWGTAVALVAILLRMLRLLPSLGSITDFVLLLPLLLIFAIARRAWEMDSRRAMMAALIVALAQCAWAALFSYLRLEIVLPLFAFGLGALLGARSLKPFRSVAFMPIYGLAAMFVIYFSTLGIIRENTAGVDRFDAARQEQQRAEAEAGEAPDPDAPPQRQTLLARLSTVNQLTQVRSLVDRNGFYNGTTLEYMSYAFIPRFLWPEKPVIAKGAWFAYQIGQARMLDDGRISNSVNMTVQGELYLNFDWPGAIIGCAMFGAFLAVLWTRTSFWTDSRNTIGSMFAFYVLWSGFSLGADLEVVVTLIATYMLCLLIGYMVTSWGAKR